MSNLHLRDKISNDRMHSFPLPLESFEAAAANNVVPSKCTSAVWFVQGVALAVVDGNLSQSKQNTLFIMFYARVNKGYTC
jgi:hypothetical protein